MTAQAEHPKGEGADAYLVAQAARTHAQRAEEKAIGLESRINDVAEHSWTRADHEQFWSAALAANAKARRRLMATLTISAITLLLGAGLAAWVFHRLDLAADATSARIEYLTDLTTDACEARNNQLVTTRDLYENMADLVSPRSEVTATELRNAADALGDPADCTTIEIP